MIPRFALAPIAILALLQLTTTALAQDKTDPSKTDPPTTPVAPVTATAPTIPAKIDPDARKAVDDMVKAYQSLNSLSGKLTFTAERGTEKKTLITVFSLLRPNKIIVKATVPGPQGTTNSRTVISDGKKLFATATENPKSYISDTALPDPTNIARALGASGGGGTGLFGLLLADPLAGNKVIGPDATVIEFAPEEKVDGVDSRIVKTTLHFPAQPQGQATDISISFAIGKTDSLLRRVVVNNASPQGTYTLTELYSDLKLNPTLPDKTFVFTPAPGAKAEVPPKQKP